MTNKEKINQMSIEECTMFFEENLAGRAVCAFRYESIDCITNACGDGIYKWLESEAKT